MAASHLKRSPLTAATITQPQLNRQHSYNTSPEPTMRSKSTDGHSNATAVLANVASRAASPRRKSPHPSPVPSPGMERRTSWEECEKKREGYVSFPDFDQLRAEREEWRNRQ